MGEYFGGHVALLVAEKMAHRGELALEGDVQDAPADAADSTRSGRLSVGRGGSFGHGAHSIRGEKRRFGVTDTSTCRYHRPQTYEHSLDIVPNDAVPNLDASNGCVDDANSNST
jgi:hypothetical protein